MKQIRTAEDIANLGTILAVFAHPDDETFLAAGILATAKQHGQKVVCVTATRGEAGSQDSKKWPPEHLAKIRSKELQTALRVLGIQDHYWLDYADGDCMSVLPHEAAQRLQDFIVQFAPDSILTFGSEGWTGHPDHRCVSYWVDQASSAMLPRPTIYHAVVTEEQYEQFLKVADEKLNIFFNIDKPPLVQPEDCDILFVLPTQVCKLKLEVLAAMPSQTERVFQLFDSDFLEQTFAVEAFVRAR